MKEPQDACQKGALEKSVLAEHTWESHHPIKWEETTVVDQVRTPIELLLKETIHIRLLNPPPPLPPQQGWGTGAACMRCSSPGSREARATHRFRWCTPMQLLVTANDVTHGYK